MVNFLVYRLENGKWNKMTERKWYWRYGHSCEILNNDTMVVIGGEKYYKSVDILDLGSLSWSQVKVQSNQTKPETDKICRFQGPELPVDMYQDFTTVYQDTLFIIETFKGLVYSIPTNLTGGWKEIAELGRLPTRQVFPAPVFKESDFKCE